MVKNSILLGLSITQIFKLNKNTKIDKVQKKIYENIFDKIQIKANQNKYTSNVQINTNGQ